MRFKGSLAAVLTITLLAMSSLASACDLSCSFQTLRSGCPSATVQTQDQQTGIMPGMDMSQQTHIDLDEAQSDAHTGMVVLNGVSCTHQKCSQASVSAVGTDHGQFKITHAVAVGVMPLRVNLLSRSYIKTKASPSNLAAISPISIHLRI